MPKSYRIRTKLGTDQNIQVKLEQDFDFLEILSLKLRQEDVYADFCADYGVVVGRIVANGGFGIPNARVSVFVPIDSLDVNDPVISTLYPYTRPEDKNEDGYRYNLLPYEPQYEGHVPTGTFPTREDVLTRTEVLEIYEKYYRFTVKTNDSGDFMIVGVPLGIQTVVMDLDLSDMGCFSLRPQDLIRMGMGTPNQFDGLNFKSSENIDSLPQIISQRKTVDVASFWGEPEACSIGISRVDFDLRELGIEIQPTAVFMGSIFSSPDNQMIKKNCKPRTEQGDMCGLVTGPGEIIAVRQTVGIDENNNPVLEQFTLDNGGKVIDEDGTFLTDIPMNLDYLVTNEFGETVISQDPSIGVPTGGKYRFKIKYQSEENGPAVSEEAIFPITGDIIRANFLVPQIREYGWTGTSINPGVDPSTKSESIDYEKFFTNNNQQVETVTYTIPSNSVAVFTKVNGLDRDKVEVTANGVITTERWINFPNGGTLQLKVTKNEYVTGNPPTTKYQDCSVFVNVFDYQYIQFQRSYAMSLNWDDYADKSAAINCEDFFYQMKFNKVYTTAQLVDEYRNGSGRARFLGIKEVLDRSCESDTNKFPVNDGVRNFDIIFFLFSLLITIFTPVLFSLTIIGHVICFLWPVLRFLLRIIGTVILGIVIMLCRVVKAITFGLFRTPCPKFQFINLPPNCPLSAIPLPNMSYPDCQACECESRPAGQPEGIPEIVENTSLLVNTTNYNFFNGLVGTRNDEVENWQKYQYGFQMTMSGNDVYGAGSSFAKAPFIKGGDNPMFKKDTWSYDIPLSERFNLFNVKANYHNSANGGYNKIKTKVNPNLNAGASHTDNVLVLVVDSGVASQIKSGTIITFQDTTKSNDPNISGGTTGTTIFNNGSPKQITMTYMKTDTTTGSVNYMITGDSTNTKYEFPTDVEYFQVITGNTLSEYESLCSSNGKGTAKYGDSMNQTLGRFHIFGWQRVSKEGVNKPYDYPWKFNSYPYRDRGNDDDSFEKNVPNIKLNDDWKDLGVIFLVRGVDVHTPKQKIEYDLSYLYGYTSFSGTRKVSGDFLLNIPIQPYQSTNDWRLPTHSNFGNNNNTVIGQRIFYNSYSFTPDNSQYQTYLTKNHLYYSAYGASNKQKIGFNNEQQNLGVIGTYKNAVALDNPAGGYTEMVGSSLTSSSNWRYRYVKNQVVEGGGVMVGKDHNSFYYFSPVYHIETPTNTITMSNNQKIVMRTDRLPTSDLTEGRMVLHQNKQFAIYTVGEDGIQTGSYNTGTDEGYGNTEDFQEDGDAVTQQILQTFSCEGMVPLECYSGNGQTIGIKPEDDTCYWVGDIDGGVKKMYGGCYYLIQRNFFFAEDFRTIAEWKARFRMMFALCRNVVSLTFVNNWVNGTLYMYSFQKDSIYDNPLSASTFNSNPSYRYCTDTIVYQEINNSFFYRATPYNNAFIGRRAPVNNSGQPYRASNLRMLGNPTTIMDMGPRDIFAKEICFNPDYQGYIVDKVTSTSYKDTSDILQLMVISRLSDANFWEQVLGVGDGSIQKLFSRPNSRLDGDVTQMLSINSEFGVTPFLGSNYSDDQIAYLENEDSQGRKQPVIGLFLSANTVNRDLISPGRQTFEDNTLVYLQNTYSFTDQLVPYQPWKVQPGQNSYIFGTQENDWNAKTSVDIRTIHYQTIDRLVANPTFPSDTSTPTTQIPGYIYNSEIVNNTVQFKNTTNANLDKLLVGAPYHFYFGLKTGKSAMNKFIDKYVLTQDKL